MSPSTFVSRRESIDRWHAAVRRADEKSVKLFQIESTGVYIATSGTRHLVAYRTDGIECECAAAVAGDPVCLHRARYWQAMGMLELDETTPETVACFPCDGSGKLWSAGSWSPDRCGFCSGAGVVEVVLDRIGPVVDNVVEFPAVDHYPPAA